MLIVDYFFTSSFYQRQEQVHYTMNSCVMMGEINSEQVPFSRIFNYSTGSLDLPALCKYPPVR